MILIFSHYFEKNWEILRKIRKKWKISEKIRKFRKKSENFRLNMKKVNFNRKQLDDVFLIFQISTSWSLFFFKKVHSFDPYFIFHVIVRDPYFFPLFWKNWEISGKIRKKPENFGKNQKISEKISKFQKKSENFRRNQNFFLKNPKKLWILVRKLSNKNKQRLVNFWNLD